MLHDLPSYGFLKLQYFFRSKQKVLWEISNSLENEKFLWMPGPIYG